MEASRAIPTAAEIGAAKAALDAQIDMVKTHAVASINGHIESLAAIGLHYKLVATDGPAKPRKGPHCSACGDSGHRAPKCPKNEVKDAGKP